MATRNFDAALASGAACRRELGERVREALAEAGWRQIDLAKAAGLRRSDVSRIVTGRRVPGKRALKAVAAALDRDQEDLLPGIGALREGTERGRSTEYVRTATTRPGRVLVEVRREIDADTALEIQRLAAQEGAED